MRKLLKRLIGHSPYTLVRNRGANRFDHIQGALEHLRRLGYAPKRVIDGGAHVGDFSRAASLLFPDASFHLIEPQPACADALHTLAAKDRFHFHPVALGTHSSASVQLVAGATPSTGARVGGGGKGCIEVRGTSLDALFPDLNESDRTLLKLDLQGHELEALKGGETILPAIEVILIEVTFFGDPDAPAIPDLLAQLQALRFYLFDIAALSARFRDNRLRQGDFIFVRADSPLLTGSDWD